jgi:hypothetical protein
MSDAERRKELSRTAVQEYRALCESRGFSGTQTVIGFARRRGGRGRAGLGDDGRPRASHVSGSQRDGMPDPWDPRTALNPLQRLIRDGRARAGEPLDARFDGQHRRAGDGPQTRVCFDTFAARATDRITYRTRSQTGKVDP